jgi:hypothetical protein
MSPQVERELDAIDAALAGRPVEPELTELGALAIALREERPEGDPVWVRELDSRAAAGFPKGSPRPRAQKTFWQGLVANRMALAGGLASVLLGLVVLSAALTGPQNMSDEGAGGSSSGGGGEVASSKSGGGTVAEPPEATDADEGYLQELAPQKARSKVMKRSGKPLQSASSGSAATTEDSASTIAPPISPPPSGGGGSPRSDGRQARKVEHSASLTLGAPADEIAKTADGVIRVTDRLGGFVVTSSVSATSESGGGTFELRIPSDRLQQALADLSRLAHVRERTEAQQDITASFVSARERLEDARAERKGLLRALARATTLNETSALRARLRDASSRIAIAKRDLARVENRASYSTIAVSLTSEGSGATEAEEDDGVWTPADAADDALRVLEVAVGVALVALAIAVPLGLVIAAAWIAARLATRRRRERALDTAV